MWTKRCLAEVQDGEQCLERSTLAQWSFDFDGEKYDRPTWVELCEDHAHLCTMIVATQDISHFTKAGTR